MHLLSDYYFGRHPQDMALLEQISKVAAAARAPFIAGVSPGMFNFRDFSGLVKPRDLARIFSASLYNHWRAFRDMEDSCYVGLVLPRILLRLPYSPETAPVDAFLYRENLDGTEHSQYLWGNAAYAFAVRFTNSFQQYGWCVAIRSSETGGFQGLPTHTVVTEDGDATVQCPTEVVISDRRRAELAALGFIALCHNKNTNEAIFFETPSCHQPQRYETDEANAMTRFAGQLEYIMAASRFAHYLRAILRDKTGSFMSSGDCQKFLNTWIGQYVQTGDSLSKETKARYPLRNAHIEVKDMPGRPGVYQAVVFLQPQFQLHHLTIPLRSMTRLHSGESLWLYGW